MDDKSAGIKPIGLSYAGDGFAREQVQRHELRFSQAATLKDLSKEYAWFTLALMYTHVRLLGRDPWGDYVKDSGEEDTFQLTMKFNKPIFRGMEVGLDQEFNHVLWAMERDKWDDYCKWMGQITFLDRDQQLATRMRPQTLEIADPLYFDRAVIMPADCPTVGITAFVLDTNKGCTYLQTGAHPLMDLPRVIASQMVLADTEVWAAAALSNHPNPFGLAEQSLHVDPIQELAERVRKAREQDES